MPRLLACVVALAMFASPVAHAFQPTVVGDAVVPAVRSVWRVPGYGFLFDLRKEPASYIEAGALCWSVPFDAEAVADYARSFRITDGVATFTGAPDGTLYRFDRLAEVPQACSGDAQQTDVFDAFWTSMQQHYAFFRERGIDWQQRRATFRPKAEAGQLFAALTGALQGFSDPHLTLQADGKRFSEAGTTKHALLDSFAAQASSRSPAKLYQAWRDADHERIARDLLASARTALEGQVRWGRIGRLGYVAIDAMTGLGGDDVVEDTERAGATLDRVVRDLADTDAIIVDIAANRGGEDRVSAAIAGRFADQKRLAYTKRPYGVADAVPQSFYVEPLGPRQYLKPVYLLTSDLTVSAGETFALRMRQLPNVVQVGATTAGAFSDMLPTPLPNGWLLTISNEIVAMPNGEVPEAKGLVPQHALSVFQTSDIAAGHVAALRDLVAWIQARDH